MAEVFEKIADGIAGAEGPVLDRAGRLFVVEPPAGIILEILPGGGKRMVANTGGVPAGLQFDSRGTLWVADMKRGILRIEADGTVDPAVCEFEGAPIRGCNDLSFDSADNLYFTAPAGSSDQSPVGELFGRLAGGDVIRLDGGFQFCNGIAVSADNQELLVAETFTKTIWCYRIVHPGKLAPRRRWATLPGTHRGGPDGIDFDSDGNLLAANWGGGAIEVFDPQGDLVDRIITPFAQPSNLHFGGADGCDLWITEHTNNAVWKSRWRRPGLRAYRCREART